MDDTLTQDLKKQFDALPVEVQKAISAIDLPTKLQEIVKNNKLMIDQAGGLEIETILVLFGLEPLENYVSNLIKNVGLSSIQASVVAHDVNESIFKNVRESLKKINEVVLEEEKIAEQASGPAKEDVLDGIENPENIKNNEESVSISSLESNSVNPETYETIDKGVEIRPNDLPAIAPKFVFPVVSSLTSKPAEPFHQNISPVSNIVESKLTNTVIVPKKTILVEEKTKLPEKSRLSTDPYKEPII